MNRLEAWGPQNLAPTEYTVLTVNINENIKIYLCHGELHNTIHPHHHTPTWQQDGWQLIITAKGGIADKFSPIWVWRSKWCRPATCRETPTTQEALLLHHGDSGSSLGVWEERRWGIGGVPRKLKGRSLEICPTQLKSRRNRPRQARTNKQTVPQTASTEAVGCSPLHFLQPTDAFLPHTHGHSLSVCVSVCVYVCVKQAAACQCFITKKLCPSYTRSYCWKGELELSFKILYPSFYVPLLSPCIFNVGQTNHGFFGLNLVLMPTVQQYIFFMASWQDKGV